MGYIKRYMEDATEAYIETLLWTGQDWSEVCDDDDETCAYDHSTCEVNPSTLDDSYSAFDIAPDALNEITEDVRNFIDDAWDNITGSEDVTAEVMGRNFALTRNGHGAGFWDLGLGVLGDELTKAAKVYGEQNLYVGDDGQLHV